MAHAFLRRPSVAGVRDAYPLTLAVHAIIARGDAAETAAARRAGSGWLGECAAKVILAARCLQTPGRTRAIDNACVCKARLRQTGSLRPAAAGARHDLCQVLPHFYGRPSWHTPPAAPQSSSLARGVRWPPRSKSPPPPHARRRATHASDPSDHNTQRLLPDDQERRLERPVPPDHICQTSERLGEPRAVPPHRNHVRPVAPLIIQRVVVAAPQR